MSKIVLEINDDESFVLLSNSACDKDIMLARFIGNMSIPKHRENLSRAFDGLIGWHYYSKNKNDSNGRVAHR